MTDATAEQSVTADADDKPEPYNGLPGAFPYAFRATDSLLFKAYVPVALLLSVAITLVFSFGLITQLAETGSVRGGTFTFSRSFFLFVGLLLVAPLLAPVLSVARRHRRTASSVAYDRALALSAFLFIGSIYLALLTSAPAELREPTQSAVVGFFYSLPPIAGVVPPMLATLGIYLTHRLLK
ncbi:hypothetical protein BDK61_3535 [Haloarcula quadrata]|jgi:hypothetical protein|uniref:DUF8056 domain-containing protein n=3 Tax=Haloarcula TaxID=2237 RepID=Q5UXT9_HALMA|nr:MULTISPECIES: hypothetical protein [Haloarcula]AAV47914.1 unknown [Haloarcula marismortui ATCC 43049]EMA17654.1 hypothetical protein C435_10879 [Haloarcula californiae ATCC 33799]NHX39365.1 hypothetical protein [Haloarcula sp. R1-2]QCP92589.1 hypothetical protein E6P14_17620 [Haloarcula marismortui ATCC 43049]RKS84134.1 hypothetical protein BDK61_3535 [Haloarcula quadrata]